LVFAGPVQRFSLDWIERGRRRSPQPRRAGECRSDAPALAPAADGRAPGPPGVAAERALRSPVIHRKASLGTQSENGQRLAERALSAAATCRLQRRSLFTYLSDLITAHNRGDPFPALAA
jgi:hypothetical protein